jgi:hypothetical protein
MKTISYGSAFAYAIFLPLLIFYHLIESYHFLPSELKLAIYLVPTLGFISIVVHSYFFNKEKIIPLNLQTIEVFFLYLILCTVSKLLSQGEFYDEGFWRDLVITSTALLFFALPIRFKPMNLYVMFLIAVLCYFLWVEFSSQIVVLASVLVSNQFHVEYHFGTVSGIFLIYFIYKRKYFWILLSFLFVLLVNKRATILGVVCAIMVFYGILKFFNILNRPKLLFGFLLVFYFIFYLIAINLPTLVSLFLQFINKADIEVDNFLMGRVILFDAIQPEIYDRGWLYYFFGNGVGQSEFHIWNSIYHEIYHFEVKPFLVHNDFLKLHFDIGLVGVFVYFLIMYQLYCVSELGVFIFLSIVPLFLIDNTIIYSYNILVGGVTARIVGDDNLSLNKTFNTFLKDLKNYVGQMNFKFLG